MNQRIRELIRDVGFTDNDLGDGRDQMLIEFAELIVQEVFEMIADEQFEIYPPVVQRVKEHFGVE